MASLFDYCRANNLACVIDKMFSNHVSVFRVGVLSIQPTDDTIA
jgi:hypothetical protein